MEFLKLTVTHHGETTEEDRRITISPMNVVVVAAGVEDTAVNGRMLRRVTVLFTDGGSADLVINHSDLQMLESAIGSYCLG
jgi:hypothetical protein